jgi:hypothetical protein
VPTLTEFVLETLTDSRVGFLMFRYGATRVYPEGYRTHIAGCVRDGLIQPTIDIGVLGPNAAQREIPAGSFIMDPGPGETHYMFFNPEKFDYDRGNVLLKRGLSARELADLRGDVIHEATHAQQDWDGVADVDPLTAEGSAYLAGAITRRLWGYVSLGPIEDPMISQHAYSLWLADRMISRGWLDISISIPDMINVRNTRIRRVGDADRYVYNGIRYPPPGSRTAPARRSPIRARR